MRSLFQNLEEENKRGKRSGKREKNCGNAPTINYSCGSICCMVNTKIYTSVDIVSLLASC